MEGKVAGLHSLRGRVVEERGFTPVADLDLEIRGADGTIHRAATDSVGRFETPALFPRGVVLLRHAPDLEHPRFQAEHRLEPAQVFVPPPQDPAAPAGDELLLLRLLEPDLLLVVRVLDTDGTPARDSRVVLLEFHEGGSPERAHVRPTDQEGLARFGVTLRDGNPRTLSVFADDVPRGLVSDLVPLPEGWKRERQTTVTLHLDAGGTLRVRVLDDAGGPVPGARVSVNPEFMPTPFASLLRSWRTDERGEAAIGARLPGVHLVKAEDPRNRLDFERQVELERGIETLVEFQLPPATTELAVSGVVLDEGGAPLPGVYLSVEKDGEERWWGTRSGEDGRFELWSHRVPSLTIRTDFLLESDRFEPVQLTVPFGTRGVVLHRVEVVERVSVAFLVSDAATGKGVSGAEIWIFDPKYEEEERIGGTGPDGSARVEFKPREGLLWGVGAAGYLDAEGRVAEIDLDLRSPLVEIRLARGFDRRWRIVDAYSGTRLAGAKVRDGALDDLLAISDDRGRFRLWGDPGPEVLLVSLPGYETLAWPVSRRNGWREGTIPLRSERLEAQVREGREERR
jgi:hypothetical protein